MSAASLGSRRSGVTVASSATKRRMFEAGSGLSVRRGPSWECSSALVRADGTSPCGSRACGLADQMVALGDVRGPAGGLCVRRGGGGQVVAELVQVPAHGVPPVPLADHLSQSVGLAQPGG